MDSLVSVLTPSYNCGGIIYRLLDSVLAQTYPKIEMFVIDDGSTDDTKNVVEGYFSKFHEKGYDLNYVYQINSGQSVAINNGLNLIHGDYLVWPDADDFYKESSAIEKMVEAFNRSNKEIGMVRTLFQTVDEHTLSTIHEQEYENVDKDEWLFDDCLFCNRGFWFCSGGYMVKTKVLFSVLMDKSIYTEKDAGQNWQLMLPVLYTYKCKTVGEILYSIVVRANSHCRVYSGLKQLNKRNDCYRDTLIATIDRLLTMNDSEKDKYKLLLRQKYRKIKEKNYLITILRPIMPIYRKI
jgi:glycosyltransferase involved in cell wall biosynthesis